MTDDTEDIAESVKIFHQQGAAQNLPLPEYMKSKRGPEIITFYGVRDPLGSGLFIHIGMTANAAWKAIRNLFTNKKSPCPALYKWWKQSALYYPGGLYIPGRIVLDRYFAMQQNKLYSPILPTPPGKFRVEWDVLAYIADDEGRGYARDYKPVLLGIIQEQGGLLDIKEWERNLP